VYGVLATSLRREAAQFCAAELLEKHATVFALLIWVGRAGLICWFQGYQTYLDGSSFFTRERLQFLVDANVPRQASIFLDILERQYKFQVRVMNRSREYVHLSRDEILPTRQDRQLKGKGTYGEVYGFEFAYDEYRGSGLGEVSHHRTKRNQ
jgi:hypothetical protein